MHRIDGPGAAVGGFFTEGDPVGGVAATVVTDDWMNDIQENIMAVLLAGGVTPTKGRAADLADAIRASTTGRLLNTQVFTSSGTYTPTPGMKFAIVTVQGGGGGGAGTTVPTAGNASIGAGGNAGAFARGKFLAAAIGASQAVTIGIGGTAGVSANGGGGATTSLGALITAPGGGGGNMFNNAAVPNANGNGAVSAAPTGGNIYSSIGAGATLALGLTTAVLFGGGGGASFFGPGGPPNVSGNVGNTGIGYGSGGAGAATVPAGGVLAGGVGKAGIIVIEEYA
ncbi:hypothetical protein [Pseudomonas sp. G5(2012)]|uniref:glycine-rich domain-containing protein n=1 Tax=Pseudomonas sp. G5(2012) TaxID=1268068 RepID=UPI000689A5A9|nr:hypothetical protein [Pseudomonas sp. G5(2012)]